MQRDKCGWFQVGLLCLSVLLASAESLAHAQDTKRVVVLDFDGPGSESVRGYVVDALNDQSDVTVVPVREVENAASRLGVSLDNPADFVRVAEDLELSAFIGGSTTREGRTHRATVWVRDGSTGEVLHEEDWSRKNKAQLKGVSANFWTVMGPHILASSAPKGGASADKEPAASPTGKTEAAEELPAVAAEEPSTPSTRPALIVSIGPRMLSRNLAFENDRLGTLRSYEMNAAFALSLAAQWYPGAHSRDDWLANVGLDLDADYAIGLKSKGDDGKTWSTTAYELGGGMIVRVPLDMFEPRFRVGYVRHVFDVNTPSSVLLPSMTYSSVRLGAGTAMKIVDFLSLDVGFAYLHVLDAGELTSKTYFSKASGGGFEAGAGVLVKIKGPCAVRAGVDWRRYFFDLKPDSSTAQPGGQKLADRATDDYLRLTASFVIMLGQKGQ